MSKRWTSDEDYHVLRWHGVSIAHHDIDRSLGSIHRRLSALTNNGARAKYAEMMINALEFDALAGRKHIAFDSEIKYWEKELSIGLAAIRNLSD